MTGTLQPLADGNSKSGAGQTPKRWRTAWIRVERLLLVAGLALLAVYGVARGESALAARAALKEFATLDSGGIASSESGEEKIASLVDADSGEVDFKSWDKGRVQAYQKRVSDQSSTPLAVLRISKIHLEVPVLDGTDTRTLNHAVGRISGTGWPGARGNIGIAGHRDGFFRGLKDVSVGDAIELRTLKETDTYVVDRIHIVSPDDVGV